MWAEISPVAGTNYRVAETERGTTAAGAKCACPKSHRRQEPAVCSVKWACRHDQSAQVSEQRAGCQAGLIQERKFWAHDRQPCQNAFFPQKGKRPGSSAGPNGKFQIAGAGVIVLSFAMALWARMILMHLRRTRETPWLEKIDHFAHFLHDSAQGIEGPVG